PLFERSRHKSIYLVAFGKASISMAEAVCDTLPIKEGVVITHDENNRVHHKNVKTLVGDHPIPTERNIEATDQALSTIGKCKKNDLLITLISGGGSALLCKPRIPLHDLQKTTELLLKSGLDIKEINTIRKHLSQVKGGQLTRFAQSNVLSYIISDVVGDPLEYIASGPTTSDSTTYLDAKKILEKHLLWDKIPPSVQNVIEKGVKGELPETPKPGDKVFHRVENIVVANNTQACKAVSEKAKKLGYKPTILSTTLTGEARKVGKRFVTHAIDNLSSNSVLVAGGETTVNVTGNGRGGRNQEMVLSTVDLIVDNSLVFSSFATDGVDGNSDAAGAVADGFTKKRAETKGLSANKYLSNNDSYHFFKTLDDLLFTGPTGTNIMDIQILLHL
ncbi:MAG TPA: DUF4147 domain-containing protein, partial [Thermoplasmata archaeon]|nr:DUF4147 domain-containing protein [Thermoplasmata archaeon]